MGRLAASLGQLQCVHSMVPLASRRATLFHFILLSYTHTFTTACHSLTRVATSVCAHGRSVSLDTPPDCIIQVRWCGRARSVASLHRYWLRDISQVRLPSGDPIMGAFSADDPVSEVYSFVASLTSTES
jgi:hypothetical protein